MCHWEPGVVSLKGVQYKGLDLIQSKIPMKCDQGGVGDESKLQRCTQCSHLTRKPTQTNCINVVVSPSHVPLVSRVEWT